MSKKNKISIARSSATEYLTFVAAGGHGGIDAMYSDSELDEFSVTRKFRITAAECEF